MIIVTGARGFLGLYIMKELAAGGMNPVDTNDFDEIGFFDVRRGSLFNYLPSSGVEAVVHCAGLLMIDGYTPEEYFHVNTLGTLNVLNYCSRVGAKLLYLSTHSDVNASPDYVITEETPLCFSNVAGGNQIPFITSKVAAAQMIEAYTRAGVIQGITFRVANVRGYGSSDTKYNSVFHQFIAKAQRGEDIDLWGALKTRRDLIYVKDVARAVRMAIETAILTSRVQGLYNIGSGKGLTIEDEAESIVSVFSERGRKSNLIYRPEIEEVRKHSCVFNIEKAARDFCWIPAYSYEQGLKDMKREMEEGNGG